MRRFLRYWNEANIGIHLLLWALSVSMFCVCINLVAPGMDPWKKFGFATFAYLGAKLAAESGK